MKNLIELELKKNNLRPYMFGVLGIFITVVAMGILFCAVPILEPNDPSSHEFSNPDMIITMVSIISMSAFSILASIMHSKFVVEEYTGQKNVLLFTYPQKRSSILLAKFTFIFSFIFIVMFTVNMISCVSAGFISSLFGIISKPFTNIILMLQYSLVFPLLANFIGIISLRIGFYKKSIITPIVVSTILTSPFGNAVMLFGDNSFNASMIIGIILFLVSMGLFVGLLKTVNRMECL